MWCIGGAVISFFVLCVPCTTRAGDEFQFWLGATAAVDDINRQELADKDVPDESKSITGDMSEDIIEMWMRRVQTNPADF